MSLLEATLIERIHMLDESAQQKVLDYVSQLVIRPEGTPGEEFIQTIRDLNFDPESVREMEQAINEMYGREAVLEDVNLDE